MNTTAQQYEDYLVDLLKVHLDVDSVCVDVGCHEGAVLREMEALAPLARHIAFEPIPYLHEQLLEAHRNSLVFACALGNQSTSSQFHWVKNDPAYSGLRRREYDIEQPDIELINVEVRCLDQVVNRNLDIALIKLDIEGGEYHAMLGAKELIRRCKPLLVFESSARSSGYYGVEATMLYELIANTFQLKLNTLARWLNGDRALTRRTFVETYKTDYYFVAYS